MRRYSVNFNQTVSTTATTATYAIGLITGTTRLCQVYEVLASGIAVVADAAVVCDIQGVSAMTAGTAITPTPVELGGTASVTTASSTPTAVTLNSALGATATQPILRLSFNTRGTIRWAAVDPDSRIMVPAGGGAGGSLVNYNWQPGTISSLILNHEMFFAE